MGKAENVNSQLLNRKLRRCIKAMCSCLCEILRTWVISYIAQKEGKFCKTMLPSSLWVLCMEGISRIMKIRRRRVHSFYSLREIQNFSIFHS